MELEIQDKKENPLLDRTEVKFTISHPNQPTPKRENVREQLSKELKVPKDRIIVDHMNSRFGLATSTGYAKIYAKKEVAMEVERKHHLLRNKLIKDEKKAKPEEAEAPTEVPAKGDEAPEGKAEKPAKDDKADKKKDEPKEEKAKKPEDKPKEDKKEE
jgi:small subunit ribosomal protein S24e